jgi:hypothetical protein
MRHDLGKDRAEVVVSEVAALVELLGLAGHFRGPCRPERSTDHEERPACP